MKTDPEKTRINLYEEIDFFVELTDDPKFIKTFISQILKAYNERSVKLFEFLIKRLGETPKVNSILGKKIGSLIKEYINCPPTEMEVEALESDISPTTSHEIDYLLEIEKEKHKDDIEDIDDLEEEEWDEEERDLEDDTLFDDDEDEKEEEESPEVIDRGYTPLVTNSKVVKPPIVSPTSPVNPRRTVRIKTKKL